MPLSPTATRELLAQLGHQPKRFLGQNFLVDGNIVRKSLLLAAVAPGDRVVEVGPGLGTLTAALLDAGAEVWAIEKDPVLHAHLAKTLGVQHAGKLHLMVGDAVEAPLAGINCRAAACGVPPDGGSPQADALQDRSDFKIVANLPYAISTPWMDAVLSRPLPSTMVLMLQKEAADRYCASPGTKSFGAISVFLQAAFDIGPGHLVSGACFFPRPDIDSRLLTLVRKREPFAFSPAARALIRSLFQQRRKQVGSILAARAPEMLAPFRGILSGAGMTEKARAEEVPTALWIRLAVARGES